MGSVARLKLATYNLHSCVGVDGCRDPSRITAVLREVDADIMALQELESLRVDGADLLEQLAAATGLEAISAPTLTHDGRSYGNGLLTRLPIVTLSRIDLSLPNREPRGAIDALLQWGSQKVHVVATHLGLWPGDRRKQARRLLAAIEAGGADFALLLGDLNEWLFWGQPTGPLRRYFASTQGPRTFPARWPLLPLDQIWARPAHALSRVRVYTSPLARVASDHLPLVAELENTVSANGAPDGGPATVASGGAT